MIKEGNPQWILDKDKRAKNGLDMFEIVGMSLVLDVIKKYYPEAAAKIVESEELTEAATIAALATFQLLKSGKGLYDKDNTTESDAKSSEDTYE